MTLTIHPMIHGPLFVDCVGCPLPPCDGPRAPIRGGTDIEVLTVYHLA